MVEFYSYKNLSSPVPCCSFNKLFNREPIYQDTIDMIVYKEHLYPAYHYTPIFFNDVSFIKNFNINDYVNNYKILYQWKITSQLYAVMLHLHLNDYTEMLYFEKTHYWGLFKNTSVCYIILPENKDDTSWNNTMEMIHKRMNRKINHK